MGTKLGGFVDRVALLRPQLLCGVGNHGEVLWDVEKETAAHRRKASEHEVHGLVASPDGRAVWADGSPHAWVIDPDHPSGYMKLKLKATSPVDQPSEGVVALATTPQGRTLLAARDGAVAWTNRALRIVGERFVKGDAKRRPLAIAGDERWVYVLRAGGVVHRFLIEQPPEDPEAKEPVEPLPDAQQVKLSRVATGLALAPSGDLFLAGPQADDQLGRLWKENASSLAWEPLTLGRRALVEDATAPEDDGPKKPDFTPTRTKLGGDPISALKVDDVLAAKPAFWLTRDHGTLVERPTGIKDAAEVLGNDALLLPAMFRLQDGTARPGLVLWPSVADEHRTRPPLTYLTWGDEPREWIELATPSIRQQGWSRRGVFPLQVALAAPPPDVAGHRRKIPSRWVDRELFDALVKECKKLLKVLW
jgi:hypothetical protein